MKRTFCTSVIAALALGFSTPTLAATDWDEHGASESVSYTLPSSDFASLKDTITFSLASPSNLVLSGISSVPGIAGQAILNFGSTALTPSGGAYPNSFFLSPSASYTFLGLAAGLYSLDLGVMSMPGAGTFSLTSTISAVPEPATYALLFVGLGVIAVAVRRRSLDAGARARR